MASFAGALRAVNRMKEEHVVDDYAVAGAMALVFWSEPIPTFDLDVLVFLPEGDSVIVTLEPIYTWAAREGYGVEAEHIIIEGVPVQCLPSHDELADEAIETAAVVDYEGVPVRVVRPEYLIALYLQPQARTAKRRERAASLRESPVVDAAVVAELFDRFKLEP